METGAKLTRAELTRLKVTLKDEQLRNQLFNLFVDEQPNNIFGPDALRPASAADVARLSGKVARLTRDQEEASRNTAAIQRTLAIMQAAIDKAQATADEARAETLNQRPIITTLTNVVKDTTAQQAAHMQGIQGAAFQPGYGMGPNPHLPGFYPGGAFPAGNAQPNNALAQLEQLSNELANGAPAGKKKRFTPRPGHPAYGKTHAERTAYYQEHKAAQQGKPAKQHGGQEDH